MSDDLVARVPFLAALSVEDQQRLLAKARIRRLSRGQAVWQSGAPSSEFSFVVHGRVKLINATADGREGIVDLRGQGQLMCSGATYAAAPYCCSAVAHADEAEVVGIPRQDVMALLEENPAAGRALLREVAMCTVTLCHRVEELTSGLVERRVAMLLLRLTDQLAEAQHDGTLWIPVTLSRQDLADLCNTALETAIRTMTRLARDGIVETRPRGFLVHDRAALAALATPSHDASHAVEPSSNKDDA